MTTYTRDSFLNAYRDAVRAAYSTPSAADPYSAWAADPARLTRYMDVVLRSLQERRPLWDWRAPCVRVAFRAIGGKGPITFRALCDIPVANETSGAGR